MKKLFLLLTVMLCTTLSVNAFGLKWGVTAGYNLSWTKVNEAAFSDFVKGSSGAGWYVGPKADLDLFLGLHLDGALVYNQRKFSVARDGKADVGETFSSLDVPVNAKFKFTVGGIGVYASAGPQFSFSMGEKNVSISHWEIYNGETPLFKRDNLTTTWNFGAGVALSQHFELGLGYNVALGKTGESFLQKTGIEVGTTALPDYRLNTFNIQASYYF